MWLDDLKWKKMGEDQVLDAIPTSYRADIICWADTENYSITYFPNEEHYQVQEFFYSACEDGFISRTFYLSSPIALAALIADIKH